MAAHAMGGHHRQKYFKLKSTASSQKWFSDGFQNEIIGFEMELSKYGRIVTVRLFRTGLDAEC